MTRFVIVLPDKNNAQCRDPMDRGWRIRLDYDPDYSLAASLHEEQVLPEHVMRPDVNRIRAENGRVSLDIDEARWLRAQLDTLIALMERDHAELERYLADKHAPEARR